MRNFERAIYYLKGEGALSAIRRAFILLYRTLVDNKLCLFAIDLCEVTVQACADKETVKVESKSVMPQIMENDLDRLLGNFGKDERRNEIEERLNKGANLWLVKYSGKLAGYGWSMQAKTIEPYFFPLSAHDVHLFDYHVFSEFRGRSINVYLLNFILESLKSEGIQRVFIETHTWNKAELRSLHKTRFRQIGICRKVVLFGKPIVIWYEPQIR